MIPIALVPILKKVWDLVTLRNIAYLVGLIVLVFAMYKGYNWVYDRGASSRDQEVVDAQKAQKEAEDKYAEYKGTYDNWVANTKKAQEQYLKEQLADVAARQTRLEEAEKAARNKPTTIKEVIKYVPAQVDATYRLPVGLVRLYGESLQGRPAGSDSFVELPQGLGLNVGDASGLAVSEFGRIAAFNNAECVVRGAVILEWQDWYKVNKAKFDALQKEQADSAPKEK